MFRLWLLLMLLIPPTAWGTDQAFRPYEFSDFPTSLQWVGFSTKSQVAVGDLSGNGLSDVAIADPSGRGKVVVYFDLKETHGGAHTSLTQSSSHTIWIDGASEREPIGSFVDIGDVNGDGSPDLVIGRPDRQSAFFVPGPMKTVRRGRLLHLKRSHLIQFPGEFLALRDINGDGAPELFVWNQSRELEIYTGNPGELWLTLQGLSGAGVHASGIFAADPSGSGHNILFIGDSQFDGSGAVFLVEAPDEHGVRMDVLNNARVRMIRSPWKNAAFGASVALWDMNQDDKLDLLISASNSKRWLGMVGPVQANGRFEFEVRGAPAEFRILDVQGDGLMEVVAGPPFRLVANTPPKLTIKEAAQQENGWVRIVLDSEDREQERVILKLEYMNGQEYSVATPALIKGGGEVPIGMRHMMEWQVGGDLPDKFLESGLQMRVLADDGHFMYSRAVAESDAITADTKLPRVELQEPEFKENGKVAIIGTASDDSVIQKVFYEVDGGPRHDAVATHPPWNEPEEEFLIEFDAEAGHQYNVQVRARDRYGNESVPGQGSRLAVKVPEDAFSLSSTHTNLHQAASLEAAAFIFPNPYSLAGSGPVTIRYGLDQPSDVIIMIYNIGGTLTWQGRFPPGADGGRSGLNEISWDGKDIFGQQISSGIYAVKIVANGRLLSGTRLIVTN